MIYAFDGFVPVVHETAFVHPQAAVTGNVIIGRDVYVGPGAAIRGDWGGIVIEDDVWIGANCTILEGARIGQGAVVTAGSVVKGVLEPYGVYAGSPLKLRPVLARPDDGRCARRLPPAYPDTNPRTGPSPVQLGRRCRCPAAARPGRGGLSGEQRFGVVGAIRIGESERGDVGTDDVNRRRPGRRP